MSSADKPTPTTPPPTPSAATPVREDNAESARLCNEWVKSGLTKNRTIQFLIKTLEDLGCSPPQGFVSCRHCDQPQGSGFGKVLVEDDHNQKESFGGDGDCKRVVRDFASALQAQPQEAGEGNDAAVAKLQIQPEIFVCQQYMSNETMTHKCMVHELIHAIDMCRTNMDPVRNCLHLACTEIRAENLSGECHYWGVEGWRSLSEGGHFVGRGGECVKRRATLSVAANPHCAARADEYVTAAMARCMADNYPFERHPTDV